MGIGMKRSEEKRIGFNNQIQGKEVTIPLQKACNFGAKGFVYGCNENRWGYSLQLTEVSKHGHESFVRRMLGCT
jgi:hypothetical protein